MPSRELHAVLNRDLRRSGEELRTKRVEVGDYLAMANGEYALGIEGMQSIAVLGNEWDRGYRIRTERTS